MNIPRIPLVSTNWLADNLGDSTLAIADVRNITNKPEAGISLYIESHVPGAIFLDLDKELSDRSDLTRGRHPLPKPETFVSTLTCKEIGKSSFVVAYDDGPGGNAARLWWMMKWLGSDRAAVLDGGFAKWVSEGKAVQSGPETPRRRAQCPFSPTVNASLVATMHDVERALYSDLLLLDARSHERFAGEVEPLDRRAGHIPGAVNAPWVESTRNGVMKSSVELAQYFHNLGVTDPSRVISYCGSGVTAAMNLLALELAGLPGGRLYVGSWSEWIEHH